MKRARPVVAIDGPAGAGKSTVARRVAEELGYTLVDTGALYRAVAFAAREAGVPFGEIEAIESLTEGIVHRGELQMQTAPGTVPRLLLKGRELGSEIRTPEISMGASLVSANPGVRRALLELQRQFGSQGGVLLEGRDIGTVVFPDAEVKIFLTATDEERAERRYKELAARGEPTTLERTLDEVRKRDRQDTERAHAPLRAADDAMRIDSSSRGVDDVVAAIVAKVRKAGG